MMKIRIGFTGHRDKVTNERELQSIYDKYPGAIWIHGGAKGFDTQVENFARTHDGVAVITFRPEYNKFPSKYAPILRNKDIVDHSDIIVACYDGRKKGGTMFTIQYAEKCGKEIIFVTCIPVVYEDNEQ